MIKRPVKLRPLSGDPRTLRCGLARRIRRDLGLATAQLAELMEVEEKTVQRWLRGEATPTHAHEARMMDIMPDYSYPAVAEQGRLETRIRNNPGVEFAIDHEMKIRAFSMGVRKLMITDEELILGCLDHSQRKLDIAALKNVFHFLDPESVYYFEMGGIDYVGYCRLVRPEGKRTWAIIEIVPVSVHATEDA
jgi:transcriptional regulator with XRE-family HTH domain